MRRALSIGIALAVAFTLALVGAGIAQAQALPLPDVVDVDLNGSPDAFIREYFNTGNFYDVGVNCDYDLTAGLRVLTVRPPAVRPLWGLSSQRVAWRPFIWNATTGQYVYATTAAGYGGWTGGTAYAGHWTMFGDPSNYWDGSQTIKVPLAATGGWYAFFQVYWQNPNGTWT